MPATIELTEIGPIQHLVIPIPEKGGLCVLRGANGVGKSRALDAVQSLATGKGRVDARDGAVRGSVEWGSARMTVAKSTRRQGELEVTTLEGRLNVADLVDPGIADEEKADAKRIKALVSLSGVAADATLFTKLAGDLAEFDSIVKPESLEGLDLIQMAGRVKRDFESAARHAESHADHAEGRARSCREAGEGVDLTAESDPTKLQAELEAAIRAESTLRAKRDAADKAILAGAVAKREIAKAEGETLVDVESARLALVQAEDSEKAAHEELAEARSRLRVAEEKLAGANRAAAQALTALKTAEKQAATVATWRESIAKAEGVTPITPAQIAEASARVTKAREAVEAGALIRDAQAKAAESKNHLLNAAGARKKAQALRDAAHGTDDVLSQVVAQSGVPLRVQAGRLVLDTDRGRGELYADLSHGERWRVALDIAIAAVGKGGLLTIPQTAWEGLDGPNRMAIAEQIREAGVIALTAECAEGDIRAEEFDAVH